MIEERSESHSGARMTLWFLPVLVALFFLPLALAMGEHFIMGSDHFEELCKRVGVWDALDHAYRPFVNLFG
jgi:hypothetical protein